MFKKYPVVLQNTSRECAVAVTQMILEYYNGSISTITLNEILHVSKSGTTAYDLIEALKSFGFEAIGVRCQINDIQKEKILFPAIFHFIIENKYQHYVVVYEIDFRKKKILVADPAKGLEKMSFADFEKLWDGVLLLVVPKKILPRYESKYTPKLFLESLFRPFSKHLIQIFFLSFIIISLNIIASFSFKFFLDSISLQEPKSYFYLLFFLLIFVYLSSNISNYFRNKLLIYLNVHFDFELTMLSFRQILHLPYRYYSSKTSGDILSRIQDLESIRNLISQFVFTMVVDSLFVFITLVCLYLLNHTLFLIAFILFFLFILLFLLFRPFFRRMMKSCQEKKAEVTSYMVENIRSYETLKGIHLEEKQSHRFRSYYLSYLKKFTTLQNGMNVQNTCKGILEDLGVLFLLFVGCFLTLEEKLTIGTLLTFHSMLFYVLNPIKNVISFDYQYHQAKNALKRMLEIFYEEEEKGTWNKKVEGEIIFKNLSFGYYSYQPVLKNISFTVSPGSKVLLLGSSGSGKSTILKLLMRYYETKRGEIVIGQAYLQDYTKEALEKSIVYVSQNELLYTDTLYHNLTMYRSLKEEDVIKVAKMCYVDEIVQNNSLGYQMLIEENGFNLSGGQRQRIVLARTLLSSFEILLIDEGTNEMDKTLERKILENLKKQYWNKTIIMVSHRLENMDIFDKVVKLENGKIKEVITHE